MERASEFGVLLSSKPVAKYSWLAGLGISVNLESETVVKDGSTYVPQTGGPLQSEAAPLPAMPNIVTPFTITVAPFVPVNYVQAQTSAGGAETPAGNLPEPEGEAGVGGGPVAAAASVKRRVRHIMCKVKVLVGEKGGWVWARAWAWCPGMTMPNDAFLEAGIMMTATSGFEYFEPEAKWGHPAIGEEYPHQLYSHVHEECGGGITYYGLARFALDAGGENKLHYLRSKHGWQCGESRVEATAELLLTLFEQLEIGPVPD